MGLIKLLKLFDNNWFASFLEIIFSTNYFKIYLHAIHIYFYFNLLIIFNQNNPNLGAWAAGMDKRGGAEEHFLGSFWQSCANVQILEITLKLLPASKNPIQKLIGR